MTSHPSLAWTTRIPRGFALPGRSRQIDEVHAFLIGRRRGCSSGAETGEDRGEHEESCLVVSVGEVARAGKDGEAVECAPCELGEDVYIVVIAPMLPAAPITNSQLRT